MTEEFCALCEKWETSACTRDMRSQRQPRGDCTHFKSSVRQPLTQVAFFVTSSCNMRCPRCFLRVRDNSIDPWPDMRWETFMAVVDKLTMLKRPLRQIAFTGGEPTLWPNLTQAIDLAKTRRLADQVIVLTNGYGRHAADYGQADAVRISNYGAINRLDIRRLKEELGERCWIENCEHLEIKVKPDPMLIPASCWGAGLAFTEDYVYPCGWTCTLGDVSSALPIAGHWERLTQRIAQTQRACASCLCNARRNTMYPRRTVLEIGLWGTEHVRLFSAPAWLDRLKLAWRRRRYPAGGLQGIKMLQDKWSIVRDIGTALLLMAIVGYALCSLFVWIMNYVSAHGAQL